MKRAIKLFVALVVTFGTIQVNASESALSVMVVGDKSFRIEVTDIQGQSTSYIKDELGQVIYKSKSKESSFKLTFDLSKLKTGNYRLVIEDQQKRQTLPFVVTKDEVELRQDLLEKTFFPSLVENDKVVLVKLLANEDNDLYVNIKTRNGEVLLEDKVEGKLGLIGKRYQFEPGQYAITLLSEGYAKTTYLSIR